jgi:NitT/TauT family transport system substrate-binding protein
MARSAAQAIAVIGFLFQAAPAPAAAADKVLIGYTPTIASAPFYVAIDKGYMQAAGIDPQLVSFGSGGNQLTSTATGQTDVGIIAVAANLFNAAARGLDVRVVSSLAVLAPPWTITPFVVRKELFDSGQIRTGKDLAGRRVAVNTPGGSIEYKLTLILDSHGLKLKDVREVILAYPEQLVALQTGGIDASVMAEPFATEARRRGTGVIEPVDSKQGIGTAGVAVVYSSKLIQDRPEVGVRFMQALIRASRDLQGEQWKDPATLSILSKYTKIDSATILEAAFPYFHPDLALEPYLDNLRHQAEVHVRNERMPASSIVPTEKLVDLTFVRKAVAALAK